MQPRHARPRPTPVLRYLSVGVSLVIMITGAFVIVAEGPRSRDEVLTAAAANPAGPTAAPSPVVAATPTALPTTTVAAPEPEPTEEAGGLQQAALDESDDLRPTDAVLTPAESWPPILWSDMARAATAVASTFTPTPTATATPQPTLPPTPAPTSPPPPPTATPAPTATPMPTATPEVAQPTATETPTEAAAPTAEPTATPAGGDSGGPTAEQWAALRACESGGNYSINTGNGYYGAYQFSIGTWNWIASVYYPDLDGVVPSDAAPADQDKMAFKLYDVGGWQHWPTCGRNLL